MSPANRHTARRILTTAVLAVLSGAVVGNTIAGDLIGLSPAWQTTLWVLAALAGGALTWATTGDDGTAPLRMGPPWGAVVVVLVAISLVVLLGEPAGYYAAGAVLLVGSIAAIALRRTE